MQTKDIREKILNFMREESYAPMTSEELVDALGHDVNPNKFWDELLALENYIPANRLGDQAKLTGGGGEDAE